MNRKTCRDMADWPSSRCSLGLARAACLAYQRRSAPPCNSTSVSAVAVGPSGAIRGATGRRHRLTVQLRAGFYHVSLAP